ncbi:hypothetical protein [Paenibacillus xylanexedens]|uniref:hypothetical protein n=1 Tax=Paenibacillus xylanexedens TaxID=528191 RepID=UPI003CFE9F53
MKKFMLSTLVLLFILGSYGSAYASDLNSSSIEARIDLLYKERASVMAEKKEGYLEKYELLGIKLRALGVEFLTEEQVQEKMRIAEKSGDAGALIDVPSSNTIVWSSFRNRFVKNGTEYEVQHLTAEPNSSQSNLKGTGIVALQTSRSWQAGALGLAKTVAFEGASKISGGVDIALTVYDAVADFVKDVNFGRSTEISDVRANYTWSYTQTVDFMYVKKSGTADSSQNLAFVSTAVSGIYNWTIPSFTYKSNGAIKQPNLITGQKRFSSTSSGHRNGSLAVAAFLDTFQPRNSYVTRIDLTGVENKTVKTISPLAPMFPSQVR